jgi:hypothetical protein
MSSERLNRLSTATHAWVDEGRIAGVVTLVASNHLPDGVARGSAAGGEASDEGYGLGVRGAAACRTSSRRWSIKPSWTEIVD